MEGIRIKALVDADGALMVEVDGDEDGVEDLTKATVVDEAEVLTRVAGDAVKDLDGDVAAKVMTSRGEKERVDKAGEVAGSIVAAEGAEALAIEEAEQVAVLVGEDLTHVDEDGVEDAAREQGTQVGDKAVNQDGTKVVQLRFLGRTEEPIPMGNG